MLDLLEKNLKKLSRMEIQIYADGFYPKGTKVSHVAKWQNDGTEKIKPARFVETAERKHGWATLINQSVAKYLDGDIFELIVMGRRIAGDINLEVNRIDTGRLKQSMRYKIVKT